MTDERIAEIERICSGYGMLGVVHELIAVLRKDRETLRQHQECAVDLLDAIREVWKAVELPPDALTLYLASFIAGFARAWEDNPPQNGFVHAVVFPNIGKLQIEVRRIDGKSAAESLAEMQQQLRTAEEQRDYELNRAEQAIADAAEDTRRLDWLEWKGFATSTPSVFSWNDRESCGIHWTAYDIGGRFADARAAIDAAMAAEQEPKRA